jgi:hypothetical protein
VAFCSAGARAQSESSTGPAFGSHELQVWAGGGYTVPGGAKNTSIANAGARYGWVLTDLHGPGFLRGRFEFALDAIPVFVLAERGQTVYGASFDPAVLRWNFEQRGRVMPYLELSGGALFTNHAVPPGANAVNFTPSFGVGISVPRGRFRWSAEIRYVHISDSNLTTINPGINTLQLRIGFGRFSKPK